MGEPFTLLKDGEQPYVDGSTLLKLLQPGKLVERLPFQINQTDLLAGTPVQLVAPFRGKIKRCMTIVQAEVEQGGKLTVEVAGTPLTGFQVDVGDDEAIAAAIAEDGGVFTDETTAANEVTANDMTLFPAVPVAGTDRYNFGFKEKVSSLKVNVGTVGTGTYTVTYEYWNGSAFVALTVTDNTTDFKTVGANTVTFTPPADWATTTINGQGPFFYIRAEIQAGTTTAIPLGTQAFISGYPTGRVLQNDVPPTDGTEKFTKDQELSVIPAAEFAAAGAVSGWIEIEPA